MNPSYFPFTGPNVTSGSSRIQPHIVACRIRLGWIAPPIAKLMSPLIWLSILALPPEASSSELAAPTPVDNLRKNPSWVLGWPPANAFAAGRTSSASSAAVAVTLDMQHLFPVGHWSGGAD